ncbi:cobyrinate a,c-diamide synthase [Synechococcus elongatus]|uniref:Cobyrinate a,c-diamide synthase n=1 Tax=Synechococcus elongatus (strain ATCC 33912 / PCC 7942 / FACHB-805) TaxID=1140 RepID=Q31M34_SYNE7|nr:cobyrinate a,c-diamide synthase [Synechococcus elongatus]ABB57885.1 cobyrinate a,c-diamide synthase / hydrogenobyrinic acid a,c-diamide synthase (glutamine-hydrolysing) [Synechococcus elongatus PCC 7942 = FACHB-805]AJD57633.1 cobyrinic acid a,c-diamide synthase [Synechococcus elongatus UTEX 2973]MBD2586601.1 cobyrinate a,c-diamide synthase [Synechococcus elongatus FACHB-242]MBD2687675.1 cobyrinate a,c-diamide synthase [Synechococcus elongatus FACHB-1061]MBD2706615.1 cobyrinate a,c-diamide s
MALIIAGERSGVGKTTTTLTLLAALKARQASVQSFKVGPDYIDPMFHRFVTGRDCRNLDPILTDEDYVQHCFQQHSQTADYTLVEGVMGLFDGLTGKTDTASTAHIARILNLPILLVLNCSSTARSIAAIAYGYQNFDSRLKIAGLVLNRVGSDRHLELLKDALEPLEIPILGVLRRQDEIQIPDRHLGLIPTSELPHLQSVIDRLAVLGQQCFDWNRLEPLLSNSDLNSTAFKSTTPSISLKSSVPIAIARDRAFNFYYADNFDLLRAAGAELIEWSPLQDRQLPAGVQGLYLGGGFPEVFAAELSDNLLARQAVQTAITQGIPCYAECGGLMYLCQHIIDFEQTQYPMVGAIAATAQMGSRLTLGYREATAQQASPLLQKGQVVWGHEFHRSSLREPIAQPLFQLQNFDGSLHYGEGYSQPNLHASYLHLHFGGKPWLIQNFLQACQQATALSR